LGTLRTFLSQRQGQQMDVRERRNKTREKKAYYLDVSNQHIPNNNKDED
jgi:hypothetical protein